MPAVSRLPRRQLWANPSPTSYVPKECRPLRLRSGGLLNIGNDTIVTLTHDAVFQPECNKYPDVNVSASGFNISVIDDWEPFYASTSPQIYAIAAATVVSYMLLIILFITPRTFFVGGAGGGSGFLGRRGMISGASGSTSVIGVGSRPWLQKVAALTVAVSLTIASVDTFKIAEKQYESGFQDATALTDAVAEGMEIRIVRIISDTCLWLAQAQTLIRLFPRHKEKVMIKWAAFALILLDLVFSILNSFVYGNAKTRPRRFVDTVPALNYLFAIALSILYMAWVLYYSISKRRFAFFHPKMRNICLIAVLSLTSIVIPVLFFVLDIAKPNVSGWGNYVRWVGAAAASVVVWEWVERIEALERDENKDGILGREIFDGDEMLEVTLSAASRRNTGHNNDGGAATGTSAHQDQRLGRGIMSETKGAPSLVTRVGRSRFVRHRRRQHNQAAYSSTKPSQHAVATGLASGAGVQIEEPPPTTTTSPVSRADTNSAASTVYHIHYHPVNAATPSIKEVNGASESALHGAPGRLSQEVQAQASQVAEKPKPRAGRPMHSWQRVANHFKRQRTSPPVEVSQALSTKSQSSLFPGSSTPLPQTNLLPRNILARLRHKPGVKAEEAPLPVTVIPWQPRGQAYLESVAVQNESADALIDPPSPLFPDIGKAKSKSPPPDSAANTMKNRRRSPPTKSPPTIRGLTIRDVQLQEHHHQRPTCSPDLSPLVEDIASGLEDAKEVQESSRGEASASLSIDGSSAQ